MLTSVWEGDDHDLLLEMVPFYLQLKHPDDLAGPILDATWGNGVFWRPPLYRSWRVVGVDANPEKHPTVLADNRRLPFRLDTFAVIVYDPPHVTHPWSAWGQTGSYGFAAGDGSVGYLFPEFLAEATRVLRPNGLLLCKIADQVHSGRTWFQMVELANAIQVTEGLTLCDTIVKVRSSARPQPDGRRQLHARRRHSYWLVARKSEKC